MYYGKRSVEAIAVFVDFLLKEIEVVIEDGNDEVLLKKWGMVFGYDVDGDGWYDFVVRMFGCFVNG